MIVASSVGGCVPPDVVCATVARHRDLLSTSPKKIVAKRVVFSKCYFDYE
jgi:hypothetical protein